MVDTKKFFLNIVRDKSPSCLTVFLSTILKSLKYVFRYYILILIRTVLMHIPHIPVLFQETLEAFSDINEGYIIDCTTGFGGHSNGLLEKYENINLICNDQDDEALAFSKQRLNDFTNRIIFNKGNFNTDVRVKSARKSSEAIGLRPCVGQAICRCCCFRAFGFTACTWWATRLLIENYFLRAADSMIWQAALPCSR